MQAIGYVRVSTEDQATEGVSLDAQRGKLAAWAELHGHELLEVYADEGMSGKRADNRTGLQAAIRAACRTKGILVVWSLDRLARNTLDAIEIVNRLRGCGAQLAIITLNADTTTPAGGFVFSVFAALAQLEREQIADRTRLALNHKRERGEKLGGTTPYGFTVGQDGLLLEDEDEQRTLRAIAGMRARGMSYGKIAGWLNAEGIPSKTGGKWHAMTVKRLMDRQYARGVRMPARPRDLGEGFSLQA